MRLRQRKAGAPGSGKREEHEMVWHTCSTPNCLEDVLAPKNVARVTCGLCMQRMVGPPAEPKPRTGK
jgi:hypothetical protein